MWCANAMWNRKGQPEELVARPQAKQVVFPYMIARLHRVFFCSLNSLDSEAIGVLTSSIGYVRFGAGMLVQLQGAAAGCRCRVPLQGAAQGAAVGVVCALELASWCRCRVLLQGAVPLHCCCWVPLQNAVRAAAAGLLFERCVRFGAGVLVPLQSAASAGPCRVRVQGTTVKGLSAS